MYSLDELSITALPETRLEEVLLLVKSVFGLGHGGGSTSETGQWIAVQSWTYVCHGHREITIINFCTGCKQNDIL